MTFEQYCAVIETTARAHGWSTFLPSLYEHSTQQLRVYDTLPAPATDQTVARQWAQSYIDAGSNLYLAYRDREGTILIEEILQGQVTRSNLVNISRPVYGACG